MSKTKATIGEAHSHKPTFGASAEKPGIEQTEPKGDPTTKEGEENPDTAKKPEDHYGLPDEVREGLQEKIDQQAFQPNPDQIQKDIHQSTTEDVLAPPVSRPKTIDPNTGQIHYAGDAAKLPGGTAAHEDAEPE